MMKLDIKTIIGFVVIGLVAYLCRPINDKIADVFMEEKNDKVVEKSNEEEIEELKISGNIEGYSYVDLGLSVKWATCNIGATKPEEYGDYFAWGETEPKDRYESEKYSWKSEDAAYAQWGGSWRLPTKMECEELMDKCSWKWMTLKGMKGYKVTANNGNWIFLPAAGYRGGTLFCSEGSVGYYWSSSMNEISSFYACNLYFDSGSRNTGLSNRDYGRSVRPVSE